MKPMKILIGCECSARVRDAFRARGHDAWSCDLQECEGDPAYHLHGDVLEQLDRGWDMAIFHPDCTYLTNAGVRWLYTGGRKTGGRDEQRWSDMADAAAFFNRLKGAPIPKVAIENPVMHGYGQALVGGPPTQIVQPWWFGDRAFKATGLWLKGLEPLQPTDKLTPPKSYTRDHAVWSKVHRASPGPNRARDRSRTEPGFAKAIASNWSPDLTR